MMINQNLNSKSHFSMLRNFSSCSSLCLFSFFTHFGRRTLYYNRFIYMYHKPKAIFFGKIKLLYKI